jgi:hypothetical protein
MAGGGWLVIVLAGCCIGVFVYALVGLLIGRRCVYEGRDVAFEAGRHQLAHAGGGRARRRSSGWIGGGGVIALVAGIVMPGHRSLRSSRLGGAPCRARLTHDAGRPGSVRSWRGRMPSATWSHRSRLAVR